MNNFAIDIQNVSKRYGQKRVLDGITLQIPKGSVFGLLGRNGSGKTTLIKTLLGLIKPDAGLIRTLSDEPWRFKEETKSRLGYVPQSDRMYPWLKVKELISYTASFYQRWNTELVGRLIGEWGLNPDERISNLSEGQAQMLSIILSLGHEPELLVFDEPVASLDPAARRQFLKTILEIVANRECTVFFSTHITSDLERVADHVAILNQGRAVFSGMLDVLKDSVNKLRVHSSKPLMKDFILPGSLHCEVAGDCAIVYVKDYSDDVRLQLEKKFEARVEVYDLGLEDIFLEITR